MADIKISGLGAAAVPSGGEGIPAVQGGATVRLTPAQIATYLSGPSYLGQVATRATVPNFLVTANKQANAQSVHVARDTIAAVQVAFANWYSEAAAHETGSGGTAVYTASLQYPIGAAWQPFAWSGAAASAVVADGATSPLSDALTLATPIPAGAAFLIRVHVEASGGMCFRYSSGFNHQVAGYDFYEHAPSGLADKTTGGAALGNNGGAILTPVAIVAQTRRPSVLMIGDSRVWGYGDVPDGSGDVGELARALGPHFGYINTGCTSEKLTDWLAASSRRRALAQWCSHVAGNGSINDLNAGRTASQLLADIASAVAMFPDKTVFWNTLSPIATSTDAFVTLANQTANGSNAARVTVNRALRSGMVAGLAGSFDGTAAIESAPEAGRFAIGAGGQAITADGTHLNALGYVTMRNARAIEPRLIRRALV